MAQKTVVRSPGARSRGGVKGQKKMGQGEKGSRCTRRNRYIFIINIFRSESSREVLQPLIQRILRIFCTFKEIRTIFIELGLASNLQSLIDRQLGTDMKNRSLKPFRQSSFHAQILRLIQILRN